jgi:hypothetical protein
LCLGLLGVPTLADHFNQLMAKLQDLKFDDTDYICVKFLLLLNPGKIVTRLMLQCHRAAFFWELLGSNLVRDMGYPGDNTALLGCSAL